MFVCFLIKTLRWNVGEALSYENDVISKIQVIFHYDVILIDFQA